MWRTLTLSLVVTLALGTEDNVSLEAAEGVLVEEVENSSDISTDLGKSRRQILTAQFECYLKIIHNPPWSEEGEYCNRTWDGWLCWGDSAPGTVMQMCPGYFSNFDPAEKVTKVCNPDGQWFHHPATNRVWSNFSQCEGTQDKRKFTFIAYYLTMVGHGVSIVSLIICLIIFSCFKSLSCQRISIHKNMFLSFILNSIVIIMWFLLVVVNPEALSGSNPVSCKILAVLLQYTLSSIYFWMLCEGIYLHTRIVVAVFVGQQHLFWYYILGWGFPVIPTITYAVARGVFFNDKCWISTHTSLPFIIHGPIQVTLLVNFFFLLNINRVLITKLKVTHRAEFTVYLKAVRATLILASLLGLQHILLLWKPEGLFGVVYDFFYCICAPFQGLLVAIILCFCNAEAQTVLQRNWAQWKSAWGKTGWGRTPVTGNHFNYHNSSITETSRATVNLDPPFSASAAAAAAAPPQHKELDQSTSLVLQKNNGPDNDYSNTLETT